MSKMYDGTAEEAANFYVTLLPDSRIEAEHQRGSARQSPKDRPRRAGRRRRLSRRHLHRRDAARLPAGQCQERGLDGVFLSVKYAVPVMRRAGGGSIISCRRLPVSKDRQVWPAIAARKEACALRQS